MRTKLLMNAVILAGALSLAAPAAQAQGLQLKPGWVYAIAFPDPGGANGANGNGGSDGPGGNGNPGSVAPTGRSVGLYKIVGAADQNWYRVRPIVRNPQGALVPMPGGSELWVNLNFAMWAQEVLR